MCAFILDICPLVSRILSVQFQILCVHVQVYVEIIVFFVETFMRPCPDFRVSIFIFLCFHVTVLLCSSSDFIFLFSTFSCNHLQTFVLWSQTLVHSCPHLHAFRFKFSCVQVQTLERSSSNFFYAFLFELSCTHVHTFVCSIPHLTAFMFRFKCNHVHIFVRLRSDFSEFMFRSNVFMFTLSCIQIQNFLLFFVRSFPDFCTLISWLQCVYV